MTVLDELKIYDVSDGSLKYCELTIEISVFIFKGEWTYQQHHFLHVHFIILFENLDGGRQTFCSQNTSSVPM